jgi:hypothetical protein
MNGNVIKTRQIYYKNRKEERNERRQERRKRGRKEGGREGERKKQKGREGNMAHRYKTKFNQETILTKRERSSSHQLHTVNNK